MRGWILHRGTRSEHRPSAVSIAEDAIYRRAQWSALQSRLSRKMSVSGHRAAIRRVSNLPSHWRQPLGSEPLGHSKNTRTRTCRCPRGGPATMPAQMDRACRPTARGRAFHGGRRSALHDQKKHAPANIARGIPRHHDAEADASALSGKRFFVTMPRLRTRRQRRRDDHEIRSSGSGVIPDRRPRTGRSPGRDAFTAAQRESELSALRASRLASRPAVTRQEQR